MTPTRSSGPRTCTTRCAERGTTCATWPTGWRGSWPTTSGRCRSTRRCCSSSSRRCQVTARSTQAVLKLLDEGEHVRALPRPPVHAFRDQTHNLGLLELAQSLPGGTIGDAQLAHGYRYVQDWIRGEQGEQTT